MVVGVGLVIASSAFYVLADLIVPKLYLPDRYVRYSIAVLLVLGFAHNWERVLREIKSVWLNRVAALLLVLFTVSAFSLEGARDIGGLTPLEQALFDRFGEISVNDIGTGDALDDSDRDGMSDLNEILAVHAPGYFADNLFKVKAEAAEGGMTISWSCLDGESYSVLRASAMDLEFTPIFSGTADETGAMSYIDLDAETGNEYFYRVIQE